MLLIEHYRVLYEYEKDCNHKMLAMLDSIPERSRSDARFQQAVTLADHLAACREFWLDCMDGEGSSEVIGWSEQTRFSALQARFASVESRWTDYLARLDDGWLTQDFEFTETNGESFRLPVGIQIEQLAGHAAYHRGQVALLVTQLEGVVQGTDYADWWWTTQQ